MQIWGAVRLLCGHVHLNGQSVTRTLSCGEKTKFSVQLSMQEGDDSKPVLTSKQNTQQVSERVIYGDEQNRKFSQRLDSQQAEKSKAVELFTVTRCQEPIKLPPCHIYLPLNNNSSIWDAQHAWEDYNHLKFPIFYDL